MKALGEDIVKSTESEIVLNTYNDLFLRVVMKALGVLVSVLILFVIFGTGEPSLSSVCFVLVLAPIAVEFWHVFDRNTRIRFIQPLGYLSIETTPGWSCFIPGGPYFIKQLMQIPLPKERTLLEEQSGTITYPDRVGPDTVEVRQTSTRSFKVKLPLEDGKEFLVWATSDWNTFVEIANRINKATQEYNRLSAN